MVAGSPKFEVERASEPEASSPTVFFFVLFCLFNFTFGGGGGVVVVVWQAHSGEGGDSSVEALSLIS